MDLRLSPDPYESFRIFQGRILDQYLAMSSEFNFVTIDANQRVETQQATVRQLVNHRIDFDQFRRNNPLPLPPPVKRTGKAKVNEEVEEDSAA